MVVTRRAPAPPPAPRANSTQSSPRKKGATANVDTDALASPLSDEGVKAKNEPPEQSKKGKQKGKGKQKKGQKRGRREPLGFVDLLARALLLWFTIYTLSVCPEDDHLKSPVCRGLYHYRRLILEPYIFPPIQNALAHPSVAPYVDAVKPAYNAAATHAKPVIERTQLEWRRRVVPQWKKRVLPQYRKRVVPRLRALEYQLEPYLKQIEGEYEKLVAPYIRFATATLNRFGVQAQPYIVLAAHKSHEGFTHVKPYARPAWDKFAELVQQLLAALAVQRRKFVDPHVAQMWEKIMELSGTTATKAAQGATAAKSKASAVKATASSVKQSAAVKVSSMSKAMSAATESAVGTASEVLPSTPKSTSPIPAPSKSASSVKSSASSVVSSAATTVSDRASAVPSAASSSVVSAASVVSNSAQSLKDEATAAATAAAHIAGEKASSASFVASARSDQAAKSASSVAIPVASSATAAGSAASSTFTASSSYVASAASSGASGVSSLASSAAAKASSAITDEADDFLAQLGLSDDPNAEPEKTPEPVSDKPKEETEEEKAARLAAVAKKRESIMVRHAKWEQDLDATIAEHGPLLRDALARVRSAAAAELERSPELRAEIDALVSAADKFLTGAEGYVKTLAKEDRTTKDKLALWIRVVDKVEAKFTDRLSETENTVNAWYLGVVQKENLEIGSHAQAVREIADAAQADLGLDYAWLDDVTYHDWQRYHNLANKHAKFVTDAQRLQNGTHPDPLENPVIAGIAELESEVKDVVVGFETRLRRIKRSGDRTLASVPAESAPAAETEPVPTPEVSILPVPDAQAGAADAPPPVVIGRGRQEILDALGSVEKSEQTEAILPMDDDATKSPENIVGSLAHEVEVERDWSAVLREEL